MWCQPGQPRPALKVQRWIACGPRAALAARPLTSRRLRGAAFSGLIRRNRPKNRGRDIDMTESRKRIWGWYFFDFASQPYNTLAPDLHFRSLFRGSRPGYFTANGGFHAFRGQAQAFWTSGQTVTGLLIAVLAPILGPFLTAPDAGCCGSGSSRSSMSRAHSRCGDECRRCRPVLAGVLVQSGFIGMETRDQFYKRLDAQLTDR